MCVVSMVMDHYFPRPIQPIQPILPTILPAGFKVAPYYQEWTMERWKEYQELKRKAEEYDLRNNEPNCEKGELVEREKAVKEYIEELRKATERLSEKVSGINREDFST